MIIILSTTHIFYDSLYFVNLLTNKNNWMKHALLPQCSFASQNGVVATKHSHPTITDIVVVTITMN